MHITPIVCTLKNFQKLMLEFWMMVIARNTSLPKSIKGYNGQNLTNAQTSAGTQ